MGNFIQQRKWITKPSWFDFVLIILVWAVVLGSLAFIAENWWWILIIAILYIVIVYSAYKHVKEYQDRKKDEQ